MAGFINALSSELLENYNESVTENGAVGYRTTGKELLDLNFAVSSLRYATDVEIAKRFSNAFYENKLLAMKWMFFARDVRGGLGERRLFRIALKFLAENAPVYIDRLIPLIAEYGRFDDLLCLLDYERFVPTVGNLVKTQLEADIDNYMDNKPISLLAKWMPSVNASSAETKRYAKILRKFLGLNEKQYRKTLSDLRKYLDVVEVKMSAGKWGDIKYEAVPSRANLFYNRAFLRNDEQRRREFLAKLERGEAKINSSVLYPHDIVHKYGTDWGLLGKYDTALEAMWKGLPDVVGGNGNTIVVADGSGSMTCTVGNSSVTALEVANALAIYFAEHSSGEFKDKYITFSMRPHLVDFSHAESLHDKLAIASQHTECSNTNIEAVFNLILDTALRNRMKQEDMPANILIISDMEFDECAMYGSYDVNRWNGGGHRVNANLFKEIKKKYEAAGYKLPRLVFWNVNSRTGTIPIRENDLGVALVSGFSVNVCKMVMSGELDPFKCLLETLNSERYQPVEDAIHG